MIGGADLPAELVKAYVDNSHRILTSGRLIDENFIRRGFASVQAEICVLNEIFGQESYQIFLDAQSDDRAFEEYRTYDNEVLAKLAAAEAASRDQLDALWDALLIDDRLSAYSKQNKIKRFFPARYDSLFAPYIHKITDAMEEEVRNFCQICVDPPLSLFDAKSADIRKKTCNEVMEDAFGRLGFSIYKKKNKLASFSKKITSRYAVFIEPDIALMERHYSGQRMFRTAYWPIIPFDRECYLGSADKKVSARWATFLPTHNCVADSRRSRYDNTQSMEVMIRADALWYELAVVPFERAILEIDG